MSPVEVQMSVCTLFFSCIFILMLFFVYKIFTWQNSKCGQVNPFVNARIWAIYQWPGRKKLH